MFNPSFDFKQNKLIFLSFRKYRLAITYFDKALAINPYKITPSSKYASNKLEYKLPAYAAERTVLEAVIREK